MHDPSPDDAESKTKPFKPSRLVRQVSDTVESLELLLDTEGIMRNIVVSEFVSLDTVMHAPGGTEEDTEGDYPLTS